MSTCLTARRPNAAALAAALAGVLTFSPGGAWALSEIDACVRIVAADKAFRLIALTDSGKNLNRLARTGDYDPEATYVIVPWSNGAESVILLDGPALTPEGTPGVDLQGNRWVISTDVENCR